MGPLTIAERVKIVKTYYQNSESAICTYRALRADYGRHNRPSERTIHNTVKKFEQTGSVTDVLRPIRNRNARSTEIMTAVIKSVEKDPNLSISKRAQELGISNSTLWRILHVDLHLIGEQKEPLISSTKEHNSQAKEDIKETLTNERKKRKLGQKTQRLEENSSTEDKRRRDV